MIHKNYNFSWIFTDVRNNLEQVNTLKIQMISKYSIIYLQELDFVHEGKNAERCAADMAKFDYIHVPQVHWNLTTTVKKYYKFNGDLHKLIVKFLESFNSRMD